MTKVILTKELKSGICLTLFDDDEIMIDFVEPAHIEVMSKLAIIEIAEAIIEMAEVEE